MIDTDYGINTKAICDIPTNLMHIAAFLYSDLYKKFYLLKKILLQKFITFTCIGSFA